MNGTIYHYPRRIGRIGRTHRARISAIRKQLHEAQLRHAESLSASDIDQQDRELAGWIHMCESGCADSLAWAVRFVGGAIDSARIEYDTNPRSARYVDLRSPLLAYAQEALRRRFPAEQASEGGDARAH